MHETSIRFMQARDVEPANRVLQRAFGTQIGMDNPQDYRPDSGMIETRFRRDPEAALVAVIDGQIVGSNFITCWGSFGFFGPLTIDPAHWGKGIAQKLLVPCMQRLQSRDLRLIGLYTFADSPKHIALYRKFGFWPRFLTAIMRKKVIPRATSKDFTLFSSLTKAAQAEALQACRDLCGEIYQGLDPGCEISAVNAQSLGDTVFLYQNNALQSFAICHTGAGTEAGKGNAYVKFAALHPDQASPATLGRLLAAIEALAQHNGCDTVIAGTNLGRKACFEAMSDAGYRTFQQGIAMHFDNDPGYNQTGVFVLDDWR